MINSILSFIVVLGVLVFLHEFGHYWVARRCGVKVIQFSVGFGKPIFQRVSKKTGVKWTVGWIPLGGFVRMLDERDEESVSIAGSTEGAFNRKSVWQRIAVVSAGPLANFIVAWVLYSFLSIAQVQTIAPVIGWVAPDTYANKVGLAQGDRVITANGKDVSDWQALSWAALNARLFRESLELTVKRDNRMLNLSLPSESLATFELGPGFTQSLGLLPFQSDVVIRQVIEGSPASKAGLQVGDKIAMFNSEPVLSSAHLTQMIRESALKPSQLAVSRNGAELRLSIIPEQIADSEGNKIGRIGAGLSGTGLIETVDTGFFAAVSDGASRVWQISIFSLVSLVNMVSGDMSWEHLSGPVSIASAAGQSSSIGIMAFLSFMAMVSVSLGILNLLPIPVLDGGHLMYYFAEVLRGKPVSERVIMAGQRVGLVIIGMLTCLALFNDLQRLL